MGRLAAALMCVVNRPANRLALAALDVAPSDRVLEIGFAHGWALARIAAAARDGFVAGIDPSETMVERARRRFAGAIDARRMAVGGGVVSRIPYSDAQFDKVLTVNTIYFWPAPEADAKEVRRVLRPGGRLVLAFRAPELEGPVRWSGRGMPYFFASDARQILEAAGFREIAITVKKVPLMWVAIMSAHK
jgi:SAM-dependent methyltransferase